MAELRISHRPVLLERAVEALRIKPDGIYMDGTFGRGGHSRSILERLNEQGRLIAVDRDPQAIAFATTEFEFAGDARFMIVRESFEMLADVAERTGVMGRVDGLLLDLGVSSPQLDQAHRGFSFQQDGPLDMRMDPDSGSSAAEWLASAKTDEIADVLKRYGEERHARRIARAIVDARGQEAISTTRQLAEIVAQANPSWERDKHPATRSFQAIRIFINRELEALQHCLQHTPEILKAGGRLAVISFHSLEDRLVKRFMRDQAKGDRFPPGLPVTQDQLRPKFALVGKAIQADAQEVAENPRARSAVLRVAERLA